MTFEELYNKLTYIRWTGEVKPDAEVYLTTHEHFEPHHVQLKQVTTQSRDKIDLMGVGEM